MNNPQANCACVHPDPRECARIRDEQDVIREKRDCECVCHKEFEPEDDDEI